MDEKGKMLETINKEIENSKPEIKRGLIYSKRVLNDINSSISDKSTILQVLKNVLNYNKELGEEYFNWIGMEYAIEILNK